MDHHSGQSVHYNEEKPCNGTYNSTKSPGDIRLRPTELRSNTYYLTTIVWLNFLLLGVGPFIILLTLNISILKKMMIRKKWATKSMKRNTRTSYLRKRFKPEDRSTNREEYQLEELHPSMGGQRASTTDNVTNFESIDPQNRQDTSFSSENRRKEGYII